MDLKIHTNAARELTEDELDTITGGNAPRGPVCPNCSSNDVVWQRNPNKVIKCNKCGYKA
jgi:bacteriocin-like protein